MNAAPLVLFRPDYGPAVGGGHVMRAMSLARALIDKGARCAVALDAGAAESLAAFIPKGVAIAPRGHAAHTDADAVVFDHYDLDAEAEIEALDAGKVVCVIDDLADRRHHCHLLIDPGFGRTAADYDHLILGEPTVLIGPSYALLRPEFSAAREAALVRRKAPPGKRVLVSLGLTDVGGITGRVCEALPYLTKTDVALSSTAPSLAALRDLPNVTLHLDVRNMSELMVQADLAIGAGGSSTWERACLGLPTICLILADNQEPTTRRLAAEGALVAIDAREPGFEHELTDTLARLLADPRWLAALSARSATLCDGLGAGRVADALLAKLASASRP